MTFAVILVISLFAQMILSKTFKISENFDLYKSDLSPDKFPGDLLLEDTYNVNKGLNKKNMPGDYLHIKRNVNTKDFNTPDNGLCTPMDVCDLYVSKI